MEKHGIHHDDHDQPPPYADDTSSQTQHSSSSVDMTFLEHADPENPFAFTAEQLVALMERRDVDFLKQTGGMDGLTRGLHSHPQHGLNTAHEAQTLPRVTLYDLADTISEDKHHDDDDIKEEEDIVVDAPIPTTSTFSQRQAVFGSNVLPKVKVQSVLQLMWQALQDRTLILLTVAAVISLAVGIYEDLTTIEYDVNGNRIPGVKWVEGTAIILAVLIVVVVGSVNDYQKEQQFRKLNVKKEDRHVSVIRSGKITAISVCDIQVGDLLRLEPGDIVPADGVFVHGQSLKCDESAATGESNAVSKATLDDCVALRWFNDQANTSAETLVCMSSNGSAKDYQLLESALHHPKSDTTIDPFLISGSRVLQGTCVYIVTAVGIRSMHGKTLMALRNQEQSTPLQEKLDVLAGNIAKCGVSAAGVLLVILVIRCVINYTTPSATTSVVLPATPAEVISQITRILITAVTVVVVAVPEGLPLAVTLALAYATQRMLKDNNLVRVLSACETMGNATTVCSDKTGTLTQNKMAVVAGTLGSSFRFSKDSPQPDLVDLHHLARRLPVPVRHLVQQAIAVNTTAFESIAVNGEPALLGSKTETALIQFSQQWLHAEAFEKARARYPAERVYPFTSATKAMATVVRLEIAGRTVYRMHVKGASEMLVCRSTALVSMHAPQYNEKTSDVETRAMTEKNRMRMRKIIQSYATRCLRTLALAYKDFDQLPDADDLEVLLSQGGLTLVGVIGIEDPLRPNARKAVQACQRAGVCVRMVTGDNMLTAKSIARQCGMYTVGDQALDGPSYRRLTTPERHALLPSLKILARSTPDDKRLLVEDLRQCGEIVAVTGDGTNDGPALTAADVGFAMGIAGTEVAKEASHIILMDDNFGSIVKAISWGRCVNDSVKKFLQFQLTVNITAVVLTLVSAMASDDQTSVLTAVQLLWVNLIMDTFGALALATDPPSPDMLDRRPEPRTAPLISSRMWKMIIGQAVYQILVILALLYTNVLGMPDTTLQTMVFTTFVFCQIFNEINCRRIDANYNVFAGLTRNGFFVAIFLVSVLGQVLIVQYGGAAFQTSPLDATHWAVSLFIGVLSIPIGAFIRMIPDDLFTPSGLALQQRPWLTADTKSFV